MGIIIQKFGGTSVGTGERLRQVAAIIQNTLHQNPVIAVVSAMSGTVKTEGTTSLLLEAARAAAAGEPFDEAIDRVERQHLLALDRAVESPELETDLIAFVQNELLRLRTFLEAIQVIREISPRSMDIVMATGERLSSRLLAGVLEDCGTPTDWLDLTHAVPEQETQVDPPFFRRLQQRLAEQCRPRNGRVPIISGFFGLVPGGLLAAVGRGYTDFTTALITAGLGKGVAEEMQVWKEVDGIYTADPRKVPTARVLRCITPAEAAELTYFGSEVLHPFTMERVTNAEVPIRIKNTFSPESPGTLIVQRPAGEKRGPVTAVTSKRGITTFTIQSHRMVNAYGFMAGVFGVLQRHGVVVDLISTSEVSVSCTVIDKASLLRAKADLEQLGKVSIESGRAILSVVGEGMKYTPGTAGKMFSALGAVNVNLEMITQGSSEINISCVVREEDTEIGLRAIHAQFMERE
ncbi:MAG: aspartate kinase [Candidatus Lambdaproteobacteria bacterium]|nr:aspartate kinase [Candidatus Lambdaproteobacteria bacterium]